MDSSLQSANLTTDEVQTSPVSNVEAAEHAEEEEPHIHLPNPSLWPLLLGVAIFVTMIGLLFIPDNPWLTMVGGIFVFVGILGWALEDPMAAPKEEYIPSSARAAAYAQSKFLIGQDVVDKDANSVGTVQARFPHYILVERGGLFVKAYYIPHRLIEESVKNNVIHLKASETDLLSRGLDSVPDDLYEESSDAGIPDIKGVPMFAFGPLSPAETGHYNYGPNFPGINTDASGSYYPEEVRPTPQKYIADRRRMRATSTTIPPRVTSPD